MYEFVIPGKPHAWQRVERGVGGQAYDPEGNRAAKRTIGMLARAAGVRPTDGAVVLWVNFLFRRPKSHMKKDGTLRASAPVFHVYKPDTDNLTKLVKDALKGIAYLDDCQVVANHAEKVWVTDSESMTLVTIEEVTEDEEG